MIAPTIDRTPRPVEEIARVPRVLLSLGFEWIMVRLALRVPSGWGIQSVHRQGRTLELPRNVGYRELGFRVQACRCSNSVTNIEDVGLDLYGNTTTNAIGVFVCSDSEQPRSRKDTVRGTDRKGLQTLSPTP